MNEDLVPLLTSSDHDTIFLGICLMTKHSFDAIETINLLKNTVRKLRSYHYKFFEEHKNYIADKVQKLCSPYFWTIFEGVVFGTNTNPYRID